MLRVISMLLLVLGIIIIGAGLNIVYSDMTMAVIAVGLGLLIIIYANILDRKYLKNREKRYTQKVKHEIHKLMKISSWPAGKVLKAGSEIDLGIFLFCLFVIVIGPILIYNEIMLNPVNWENILVSGCILAMAVLYFFYSIPYLGKPACELSRDGFFTPRWGFIPWHQVFGIGLSFYLDRFRLRHYTLCFYIKNSQSILEKRRMQRMLIYLGLVHTQDNYFNIDITLNSNSKCEAPETIKMVAKLLWEKATGRQHNWNP